MNALRTLIALAKTDGHYWQFPLVLSAVTVSALFLSAWSHGIALPWLVMAGFALLFILLSTLTAWWLLLGKETRR